MVRAAVGIDLSLTSTGLASVNSRGEIDWDNVKTKGKRGDTLDTKVERMTRIMSDIRSFVLSGPCDLAVIEAPSYGSSFGNPHERGGLWWAVVSLLTAEGIPVATVSPQGRAKYATGSGRSQKDVVLAHAIHRYADIVHGGRIVNDDVADAIVLASMGARHLGFPVERDEMDETNLAAMGGASWPQQEN